MYLKKYSGNVINSHPTLPSIENGKISWYSTAIFILLRCRSLSLGYTLFFTLLRMMSSIAIFKPGVLADDRISPELIKLALSQIWEEEGVTSNGETEEMNFVSLLNMNTNIEPVNPKDPTDLLNKGTLYRLTLNQWFSMPRTVKTTWTAEQTFSRFQYFCSQNYRIRKRGFFGSWVGLWRLYFNNIYPIQNRLQN